MARRSLTRVRGEYPEIVRLLRDAGAAVNQADSGGFTPLIVACEQGHLDCVRLLLEASAAVNQAKDGGATPRYTSRA